VTKTSDTRSGISLQNALAGALFALLVLRATVSSAADGLLPHYSKDSGSFYPYLPTYIGYTVNHSDPENRYELKFQVSVKYELIEASDWYFAYTQKSFWSTQKVSAPFRESNFAPETFWLYQTENKPWMPFVQIGFFRHESTGEAGPGSRGWNITYIEPAFKLGEAYIIPRIWVPSVLDGFSERRSAPDNTDIYRYSGYGKLTAVVGTKSETQTALTLQYAPKDHAITWEAQADLTWRYLSEVISKVTGIKYVPKWNPSYFVQARNGYGEGLKTYNQKTSSVIVGISLVR
jgi:phospholipase A1/A2